MKAKVQARIVEFQRNQIGDVKIKFHAVNPGKVETKAANAQEVYLNGEITLRALIADQLKIGATLTITVTDDEPDDKYGHLV